MDRMEADLRDHYWYDELVHELLEEIERYLELRAALGDAVGDSSA
jgi:hypothetical protein